jgi:hypothetical protein
MKRTLFLQAPSFDGYDGGAGARYQMKREVKSFWYPTWLAQPAAMVPGSKLIDAPAHDLSWDDIAHEFDERDLVILHTSTPSFGQDIRTAELIKARNPNIQIAFVGAKVMIDDEKSLKACNAIDLVCREEYDFTCVDLAEGKPWPKSTASPGARPMVPSSATRTARWWRTWMCSPWSRRSTSAIWIRSNISAAISAIPMSSTRAAAARAAAPSACGRRRSRVTTIAIAACPR